MEISNITTSPVSTHTWILPLGDKRAAVIDPGGNSADIVSHISSRGLKPCVILLTHGHFDHVAAIPDLKKRWPGIKTGVHPADARCLGKNAARFHRETLGAGISFLYPGGAEWMDALPEPDFFLEEGPAPAIPECGRLLEGWEILHTPGHTPGSICLLNRKSKTLFSGDTLFRGGVGRTDLPGGDWKLLRKSLEKLSVLDRETLVLPGHGETTSIGAEYTR